MKRLVSVLAAALSFVLLGAYCIINIGQDVRAQEEQRQAEFIVTCAGSAVKPWEDEKQNLYVFLPSYFDWDHTEIEVLDGTLSLDGVELAAEEGMYLSAFEENTSYLYTLSFREEEKSGELTFVQSANVGTIFLETDSGSMEQVDADKEYREGGRILITDAAGGIEHIGILDYIKGRGNNTWYTTKKSYSIKLNQAADLYDMGEAEDWVLLSNVVDASKIQNKLCLDMAKAIGLDYSIDAEWVDLYLNGVYHGNYLLCEKVEAGENRIEVGDGLLIERDYYFDQENGFHTEDGNPFSLRYPQTVTEEELAEIAEYVQRIEDAVLAGNLEMAGKYLDWESFVLRYVLDEAVLNQDTGVSSMYFYKPEGEQKLYSGPIWDYDRCFGSGHMTGWTSHKIMAATELQNYKGEIALTWYPVLYQNEWFQAQVKEKYRDIIRPYLLEMLNKGIDSYVSLIEKSVEMDAIRRDYSRYETGYYKSYENNIRYLKFFLAKRLEFLDEEWLGEESNYTEKGNGQIHTVTFRGDEDTVVVEIPDCERLLIVPEELLKEGQWWYNVYDDQPYTPDLPVLEDVVFKAE